MRAAPPWRGFAFLGLAILAKVTARLIPRGGSACDTIQPAATNPAGGAATALIQTVKTGPPYGRNRATGESGAAGVFLNPAAIAAACADSAPDRTWAARSGRS
jgi:hypothetical protein